MANADTLKGLLDAIGDAIRAKTGGSATLTLAEMPDEIAGISGGKVPYSVLKQPVEQGRFRPFNDNATMYEVLASFDFSGVEDLRYLMRGQNGITEFDFAAISDASPTSLYGFIGGTSSTSNRSITVLKNVGALDTSNVSAYRECFQYCAGLTEIDLSSWTFPTTVAPYTTTNMFNGCVSLQKLVLPATFTNTGTYPAKFPVAMQDENGNQYASGATIPDGAHTYTATA